VRVWTFGKFWEDLSLEVIAGGLGGARRLWRQESVFKTFRKKLRERSVFGHCYCTFYVYSSTSECRQSVI